MGTRRWDQLNRQIVNCDLCPRLRAYCAEVAREKRRAYREWDYWGRPVPNFGDPRARLLIVGLAPAAHGANRTGRMFTGDQSGLWLYRALHKAGFANQANAEHRDDGLELHDCAITAACHCAPPANKPQPDEIGRCQPWFDQTLAILPVRVVIALGQIGWTTMVRFAKQAGWIAGSAPKFAHAGVSSLGESRWLVGSYHPSQQNTFTNRLTEPMLDDVFRIARELLSQAA